MKYTLFAILTLIIIACGEGNNSTDPWGDFNGEAMPLAVGNYWIHDIYNYGTDRNSDGKLEVIRDTIVDGKTVYLTGDYSNDDLGNFNKWGFSNSEEGLLKYNFNSKTNDMDIELYFKFPCNEGDIYNDSGDNVYRKVISTNEKLEFEGKERKAIVYEDYVWDYPPSNKPRYQRINRMYVVPGIGIVKAELFRKNVAGDSTFNARSYILVDYKLN